MRAVRFVGLIAMMALAATSARAGDEVYGDGVSQDEAVPIATLLGQPADYVGKTVRVDGVITGVCEKRGCWMQVTDPDTGDGVRIKVEDGVIVFPYTAMGHRASAEGVFEAITVKDRPDDGQDDARPHQHGPECERAKADGTTCDAPARDQVVYLIRGTGAVISS